MINMHKIKNMLINFSFSLNYDKTMMELHLIKQNMRIFSFI